MTAIDRNVWQYLADATQGTYDPACDLSAKRDERIAVLRIALYAPSALWITPSVHTEFEHIKATDVWRSNAGIRDSFLHEVQPRDLDLKRVTARTRELRTYHPDEDDCRAIAEAEEADAVRFLSFDHRLRKRLARHTSLDLVTPRAYWPTLGIPRGAEPRISPAPPNPLASQTWWRW